MSTRSPWRLSLQAWAGLLALGVSLWLIATHIGIILEVMWVLFGSLLLGLAMYPLADRLVRWKVPRGLTVIGVYVGLLAVLTLVGTLLVPVISTEIARLRASGPDLLQTAFGHIKSVPLLGRLLPSSDGLAQYLAQRMDLLLRPVVSTVAGLGELALDVVVALILAYFFATGTPGGASLLHHWLPTSLQPRAGLLLARLRNRLSRWVWAQLALAAYLGVAYSIGLSVLGVPFALTIGVIGGVLEIVPYLGGVSALLLAVISALTVRPLLVLWVVLFHIAVTEVESHVLAPTFFGRAVGLHPAVVLIALLIGVKAGGVIGVFFAVPAAVVLVTLMEELRAVLSEPEAEPSDPASGAHSGTGDAQTSA
jgi:predicted PurR-regulated permease PerM